MQQLNPVQVRDALRRLSVVRPPVFGSESHGFRLNPPLAEAEIAAFEARHQVSLPSDYRAFVARIGNGGAGPCYGLFPLGYMDGLGTRLQPWREQDGTVGILSSPFPHHDAWNDMASTSRPSVDGGAVDGQQREAFERKYFDSAHVNGAVPICHEGCAHRVWLVLCGDEAGHLWLDGRASDGGIEPIFLKDGSRARFGSWYQEWLVDAAQRGETVVSAQGAGKRLWRWLSGR